MNIDAAGLIIIDAQEKLMSVMKNKEGVTQNIVKLLHLARIYELPISLTEQYPKMIGPTLQEISSLIPDFSPVEKLDFDACQVEVFMERLKTLKGMNVIVTGVETHVCVLQTCSSLLSKGYNVFVPRDCVDSRTEENKQTGLELLKSTGAAITSAETVIFQFLKKAGTPEFKEMLKYIK